jgi:hypothetical protein
VQQERLASVTQALRDCSEAHIAGWHKAKDADLFEAQQNYRNRR